MIRSKRKWRADKSALGAVVIRCETPLPDGQTLAASYMITPLNMRPTVCNYWAVILHLSRLMDALEEAQ